MFLRKHQAAGRDRAEGEEIISQFLGVVALWRPAGLDLLHDVSNQIHLEFDPGVSLGWRCTVFIGALFKTLLGALEGSFPQVLRKAGYFHRDSMSGIPSLFRYGLNIIGDLVVHFEAFPLLGEHTMFFNPQNPPAC